MNTRRLRTALLRGARTVVGLGLASGITSGRAAVAVGPYVHGESAIVDVTAE